LISTEQMAAAFARNVRILHMQNDGLTHADSLIQPQCRGNCLNWLLGHLLLNRNRALVVLGAAPVVAEAEVARYPTESEPVIGDDEGVLTLDALLDRLDGSQEGIAEALRGAAPADLAKEIIVRGQPATVGQALFSLYFHETYHTGQAELLRQLAGKNDKVI
jgi:DinB superfamily